MSTRTPEQIALAARIDDQLTAHPEMHDQMGWVSGGNLASLPSLVEITEGPEVSEENMCGSTACVSGWAMLFSGYRFREAIRDREVSDPWGGNFTRREWIIEVMLPERPGEWLWFDRTEETDPNLIGRRLLGLSDDDAWTLFFNTTEAEAAEAVAALADGDDERFSELMEHIRSSDEDDFDESDV